MSGGLDRKLANALGESQAVRRRRSAGLSQGWVMGPAILSESSNEHFNPNMGGGRRGQLLGFCFREEAFRAPLEAHHEP